MCQHYIFFFTKFGKTLCHAPFPIQMRELPYSNNNILFWGLIIYKAAFVWQVHLFQLFTLVINGETSHSWSYDPYATFLKYHYIHFTTTTINDWPNNTSFCFNIQGFPCYINLKVATLMKLLTTVAFFPFLYHLSHIREHFLSFSCRFKVTTHCSHKINCKIFFFFFFSLTIQIIQISKGNPDIAYFMSEWELLALLLFGKHTNM